MKQILSVSHTDLDGYGSQYVLKHFVNIDTYVNLNYKDLDEYFLQLDYSKIKELYITDLNISEETAHLLDSTVDKFQFKLVLIDHHATGKELAEKFDWYHLNTKYSATYNVGDYFNNNDYHLNQVINLVDCYDMWRKDNEILFNRASLLSSYVFNKDIEDPNFGRFFIFNLIKELSPILTIKTSNYVEENGYYNKILNKSLVSYYNYDFINDLNMPLSTKCVLSNIDTLNDHLLLDVESKFGQVKVYQVSYRTSQYCFDYLLQSDRNTIYVNVINKKLSIRSVNGGAQKLAELFNGGGHANASGAKVPEFNTEDELKNYFLSKL